MPRLHLKYRLMRTHHMVKGAFTMLIPIWILAGMVVCSLRFWFWVVGW